jgi:hypothetical protein
MMYGWDEITRPHRTEYRKMVKRFLDDNAWGPIATILEAYNPQTAQRLDSTRKSIMDKVSSDVKLKEAVEMRQHELGPSIALKGTIQQLIDALVDIARRVEIPSEQAQVSKTDRKDGKEHCRLNRLGTWLWKLYDKTIKALFDALFDSLRKT